MALVKYLVAQLVGKLYLFCLVLFEFLSLECLHHLASDTSYLSPTTTSEQRMMKSQTGNYVVGPDA